MPVFPQPISSPTRLSGAEPTARNPERNEVTGRARDVFRRFFDLIGQFERPHGRIETKSAQTRGVRITRIDDETFRIP